jgi:hypothetical protein
VPGWAPPQRDQQQQQHQQYQQVYQQHIGAYYPAPLPPELPAMRSLQPHPSFWPGQLSWPGSHADLVAPPAVPAVAWALGDQQPQGALQYSSPPSAAPLHSWLGPSPVLRSSRRSSSGRDGGLLRQMEAGMASLVGTLPSQPAGAAAAAAAAAKLGIASSAELPPKPGDPQQLDKLDSGACASSSWQAASCNLGEAVSERASSAGSTAAESAQANSNGNTTYRSSGSLGSSALEALVAAAEEADIPRVESEMWEADCPLTLSAAASCVEGWQLPLVWKGGSCLLCGRVAASRQNKRKGRRRFMASCLPARQPISLCHQQHQAARRHGRQL